MRGGAILLCGWPLVGWPFTHAWAPELRIWRCVGRDSGGAGGMGDGYDQDPSYAMHV